MRISQRKGQVEKLKFHINNSVQVIKVILRLLDYFKVYLNVQITENSSYCPYSPQIHISEK